MIKQELKFLDTPLSVAPINATGQFYSLNNIATGNGESQRSGRRVKIKGISYNGRLQYDPSNNVYATGISAIYLIVDKQCNGALPTYLDVFTVGGLIRGQINMANKNRFEILHYFIHVWNPPAGISGAYNHVEQHMTFTNDLNIDIFFNGATGATTEITSSNLIMMFDCDLAALNRVSSLGTARIYYTD